MLHCAKADISATEEAGFVVHRAEIETEQPLRGIMHAGAVLDSKIISNINVAGIRTEFSGT